VKRKRCVAGLATILVGIQFILLAPTGPLQAQEAYPLEDIVVTGTKIHGALTEIPCSATIVGREDIDRTSPENVADILRTVPGVLVRDFGDRGMVELSIRGVGASYGSRYVMVLVDGFPINQGASGWIDWTMIAPEAVERIEILKGPFSAVYGSQAVGGVINIVTKSGRLDPRAEASFEYGSYDAERAAARVGGAFGKAAFSLSGVYTRGNGYRDNSAWEDFSLFAKLDVPPDTRSRLQVIGNWTRQDEQYPGPLTLEQMETDPRQSTQPGAGAHMPFRYLAGARYERLLWDFADLGFQTYLKGRKGSWRDVGLCFDTRDAYTVGNELLFTTHFDLLGHSQVLMLGGLVELDHEHLDLALAPDGEIVCPYASQTYLQTTYSVFLQGRFRLLGRLLVEPGVRADLYDFHMTDDLKSHVPSLLTSLAMSGLVPPGLLGWLADRLRRPGDLSKDLELSRVSPRLAVSYGVTDDLDVFLNYGEGYKVPWPALLINNPTLTPEYARSVEAGVRSRLFSGHLLANASLYYTRVRDGIVMVEYNTARNLSETVCRGVEIQLRAPLPYGFNAFFNYAYQRAEYEKTVYPPLLPGLPETTYEGGAVPLVPDHMAATGLSYVHARGFRADLVGTFVGKRFIDLANTRELDSYFLLGLKLSVPLWRLRLWAAAENLLDETYVEYAYYDAVPVPVIGPIALDSYYPMPGRTFSGGLMLAF